MLFRGKLLNKFSPFAEIAQCAIETYYLPSYPGAKEKRPGNVNRFYHGGVHASSTAINLELFYNVYQRFRPDLLKKPDGSALDEEDFELLLLAAIYHDSANVTETDLNTSKHADNFRQDMLKLGFDAAKVEETALAMVKKDGEIKKNKAPFDLIKLDVSRKSIQQKLLQSADCLDNLRTRGNLWEKKYLDILYDLMGEPGFNEDLETIIENHRQKVKYFQKLNGVTTKEHRDCELADNCYSAVKQFYDRLDLERSPQLVNYANQNEPEEGCYVRILQHADIAEELNVLQKNLTALQEAGIQTSAQLKDYMVTQEKPGVAVVAPGDLKWRPATFIPKQYIPIMLYAAKNKDIKGVMLIISTEDTYCSFFYKKNVFSNTARNGRILYSRSQATGAKSLNSVAELQQKLHEMNLRRQGHVDDSYLQYFGLPYLEFNETLLTYYKKIVGLGILGNTLQHFESALLAREKLKDPSIPLFFYTAQNGLRRLTDVEIADRKLKENESELADLDAASFKEKLKLDRVNSICILQKKPLKLKFKIDDIDCVGYVKGDVPVIEFDLKHRIIIVQDETRFLRDVYHAYAKQTMAVLNYELSKIENSLFSNSEFGVFTSKNKFYISIEVRLDPNANNATDNVTESMCFVLGPYAKKLKMKSTSPNKITYSIPMCDVDTLKELVLKSVEVVDTWSLLNANKKLNSNPSSNDNLSIPKNSSAAAQRFFPKPIKRIETVRSVPNKTAAAIVPVMVGLDPGVNQPPSIMSLAHIFRVHHVTESSLPVGHKVTSCMQNNPTRNRASLIEDEPALPSTEARSRHLALMDRRKKNESESENSPAPEQPDFSFHV